MGNKIGTIQFTKEMFVETIGELKKQYDHDRKCSEAFQVILPTDFISGYNNSKLTNQLVKILAIAFNDNHEHSWIEYFLWELDWGAKYKEGSCTNPDGSFINLSDAGSLYDFLIQRK